MSAPEVTIFLQLADPATGTVIDLIKDRPEDMPVHDRLRAIGCGIGAAMTMHSTLDLREAVTFWTPLMEGIQEGFRLVSTAAAERQASGKGALQ